MVVFAAVHIKRHAIATSPAAKSEEFDMMLYGLHGIVLPKITRKTLAQETALIHNYSQTRRPVVSKSSLYVGKVFFDVADACRRCRTHVDKMEIVQVVQKSGFLILSWYLQ